MSYWGRGMLIRWPWGTEPDGDLRIEQPGGAGAKGPFNDRMAEPRINADNPQNGQSPPADFPPADAETEPANSPVVNGLLEASALFLASAIAPTDDTPTIISRNGPPAKQSEDSLADRGACDS